MSKYDAEKQWKPNNSRDDDLSDRFGSAFDKLDLEGSGKNQIGRARRDNNSGRDIGDGKLCIYPRSKILMLSDARVM